MRSKLLASLRGKWKDMVDTAYNAREFRDNIKKPSSNYHGPWKWKKTFKREELPVTSRVFTSYEIPKTSEIGKEALYKNPEYYSYHTYSYYDTVVDLRCARSYRPQPSSIEDPPPTTDPCKCVQERYEELENPKKIIKKIK